VRWTTTEPLTVESPESSVTSPPPPLPFLPSANTIHSWAAAISNGLLRDGLTVRVEVLSNNRTAEYGNLVVGVVRADSVFVDGPTSIPGVKSGIGYSVVGAFVPNYRGLPIAHLGDEIAISRTGNRVNFMLNRNTFIGALGLPDNGDYYVSAAMAKGAAVNIVEPSTM